MIEINPKLWRTPPRDSQIEGVKHLIRNPFAGVFDEQGVGKTKQIIDAACTLFSNGVIDTVVVVCPPSVRGVWDEPEFGELRKHCWVPYYTVRVDKRWSGVLPPTGKELLFVLLSYGYLRREHGEVKKKFFPTVRAISPVLQGRKVWTVFDESSYVKSHTAAQYRASFELSRLAPVHRRTILNGTPIANNALDLWSQFNLIHEDLLKYNGEGNPLSFTQFRSRYMLLELKSIPGRRPFYNVLGEDKKELDILRKYVKPWIIRRTKDMVLDLPPKIYSILEAELSPAAWKIYKDMSDELVAFFERNPSMAANGAVKSVRLSQITSGFLGGIRIDEQGNLFEPEANQVFETKEIDRAKLDVFEDWFENLDKSSPIIVWCRFRAEMLRLLHSLESKGYSCGIIYGGQSDKQRQEFINRFQKGKLNVLIGQPKAGGIGLNLIQANTEIYISNDYNLISRLQSEDRVHRGGQTKQVYIIDILAVGPKRQKTIDHLILKALRDKEEIANWTAEEWKRHLSMT
jgi:SNF2 family DNA or RNA helicase